MKTLQRGVNEVLSGRTLSTQHAHHGRGERLWGVVNVVNGGRVNLTAEQLIAPSLHPPDHVRISVIHVYLDIPRWHFAALVVDDVEGYVCGSPIVFVSLWRRLVWDL